MLKTIIYNTKSIQRLKHNVLRALLFNKNETHYIYNEIFLQLNLMTWCISKIAAAFLTLCIICILFRVICLMLFICSWIYTSSSRFFVKTFSINRCEQMQKITVITMQTGNGERYLFICKNKHYVSNIKHKI